MREEVRSQLAAIVDSSDDAIISKNLDGVIATWNRAAQRLFGYAEEEVVGQPITILLPPELHAEERDILRRLRAGERIDHFETRRLTRDGRLLDVSLTISPVRNARGAIVGASKILRDITDSKRAQAAIAESEQRLAREVAAVRTLQSISTRLISESTQESLFAQIVDAAMELMGADAASVQTLASDGVTLTLLGCRNFHPDSAAFWERVPAEAGSTCGAALRRNTRVLVTDVDCCEFMAGTQDLREYRRSGIRAVQSTPLLSRAGHPLGMLSTHWHTPHAPTEQDFTLFDVVARQAADLIERTAAEGALRESEERFRLIASSAPVIIWMSNAAKGCTYVNQAWLDFTGQSFNAVLGTGWTKRIHPDDVVQCWNIYARAFDRRERFQMDFRLGRRDGEYRWIVSTGAPRYHPDGSFAGYIGSAIDFTERRLAEQAIATINQRLIDAQEEQCARMARELHDDVVQRLSSLSIRLHAFVHSNLTSATDAILEIDGAREEVMNLARDVQDLSRRLHPARLGTLGIAAAAAAVCGELSRQHGVEISCQSDRIPEGVSHRVTICLYRVLQEALQNAIKHAQAGRIDVSLRAGRDQIEPMIRDAGIGFNVDTTLRSGLGLTSMNERVKAVGGRLTMRSRPGGGTTIHACIPLLLLPDAGD